MAEAGRQLRSSAPVQVLGASASPSALVASALFLPPYIAAVLSHSSSLSPCVILGAVSERSQGGAFHGCKIVERTFQVGEQAGQRLEVGTDAKELGGKKWWEKGPDGRTRPGWRPGGFQAGRDVFHSLTPAPGVSLLPQPRNPLTRVPCFSLFPGSFQHLCLPTPMRGTLWAGVSPGSPAREGN